MALSEETIIALRKEYNPEGSPLREYQLRLLEILKYFDSVCKKHNIKYWLDCGTCLGAIRHGGFIPWDDDIDVAMFREDYNKLLKVFEETDNYVLQTSSNDAHYVCTYAKVRDKKSWILESVHTSKYKYPGAFIDVFIIEKGYHSVGKFTANLTRFLDGIDQKNPSNFFRDFTFRLCKPLFLGFISVLQKVTRNFRNSEYMVCYGTAFWDLQYFYEDMAQIEYKSFEGYSVPVPAGWDHYLTSIFGDYMSLPDLSKVKGDMHVKEIRYFK